MKILITQYFLNQSKRLVKKFPHLKEDLIAKLNSFLPENEIHIGKSVYKIRIKSQDLDKGKSGGLRSYIYLYRKKELLVPICIYFKSEHEAIGSKELEFHLQRIVEEIFGRI